MCGICGGIGKNLDPKFLSDLLLGIEVRGREATGIYSPSWGIKKAPMKASLFLNKGDIKKLLSEEMTDKIFIGHTRLATHGDPKKNENNHPLESENFVMVHNGVVQNEDIPGYGYKSETDSERMLSYIEKYGIKKGLAKTNGKVAMILVPKNEENTLYIYKTFVSDLALLYDREEENIYIVSALKHIKPLLTKSIVKGLFPEPKFLMTELPSREVWKLKLEDELKVEKLYDVHEEYIPPKYNYYTVPSENLHEGDLVRFKFPYLVWIKGGNSERIPTSEKFSIIKIRPGHRPYTRLADIKNERYLVHNVPVEKLERIKKEDINKWVYLRNSGKYWNPEEKELKLIMGGVPMRVIGKFGESFIKVKYKNTQFIINQNLLFPLPPCYGARIIKPAFKPECANCALKLNCEKK